MCMTIFNTILILDAFQHNTYTHDRSTPLDLSVAICVSKERELSAQCVHLDHIYTFDKVGNDDDDEIIHNS